jgi:xanthine dehydrogenase small subunit
MALHLVVNGRKIRADGYPTQTTLLDFLRAQGLTGAKEGCAEGECGACTVAMMRPDSSGSRYMPVNSCLLFLPMCAGQEIWTVEALANGDLSPAQAAMVASGGSQCGYCTPGFIVSMFAEQYRTGGCEPHALSGNLCRCTGYRPIADAARTLGAPPSGPLRDRMSLPAPEIESVEYDGFARPVTLEACLELMERQPDARLIAGGTDLGVESNLRLRRYPFLIGIEAVPELRAFSESAESIEIGAALTLAEIDIPHPVWREWTDLFASPLIRNRATLGGNLATASPIGDGAPLLLVLDAQVRIAGRVGERIVPLDSFFTAYRKTLLGPGELIRSIVLPKPLPPVARFFKAAKRRMDDISTVAACIAIHADGSTRLAYGGVAGTPVRVRDAEAVLTAGRWREEALRQAQEILASTLKPIDDHRGSGAYRLALSQSLLEKFWWERQEEVAA